MPIHRCVMLLAIWTLSVAAQTIMLPNGTLPITACVSPPPDEPVYITFSTWVRPYSGDHQHHSSSRPQGTVQPAGEYTDANGCAQAVFSTPDQVAGEYEIYANCAGCIGGTAQVSVLVYPYLQNLPPHSAYNLMGQTAQHQNGWFGTFNTVLRVQQTCIQFYNETGKKPGVNDLSIGWGGLFDIAGNWTSVPGHIEHRWGLNADIPY